MIIVKEKLGNIHSTSNPSRNIDILLIEWHETRKRILHKKTRHGKAIIIKFLNENPNLKEGDILWQDETTTIVVEINSCECIVVMPGNILNASAVSYEIGNRHLPLFFEGNELLIPCDAPLYSLLQSLGYAVKTEQRKLNQQFQTTVFPHVQVGVTDMDKINQLTTFF
jgi:urease accessory protein